MLRFFLETEKEPMHYAKISKKCDFLQRFPWTKKFWTFINVQFSNVAPFLKQKTIQGGGMRVYLDKFNTKFYM